MCCLCKVREFLGTVFPFLNKILWFKQAFKALILMKLMMPAAADKSSFRIFAESSKITMKCGALPHPQALPTRHSNSFNLVICLWNHHIHLVNEFIPFFFFFQVLKWYASWLLRFFFFLALRETSSLRRMPPWAHPDLGPGGWGSLKEVGRCGVGRISVQFSSVGIISVQFSSVQSLSRLRFFANSWTAAGRGFPVHHKLPELS